MPELDLAPDERAARWLAARAWSGATRDRGRGRPGQAGPGPGRRAGRAAGQPGRDPARCWRCCWRPPRGASRSCSATGPGPGGGRAPPRPVRPGEPARHLVRGRPRRRPGGAALVPGVADRLRHPQGVRPTSRGPDFEVPAGFDPGKVLPTAGEPEGAPMALVRAARAPRPAWPSCAAPSPSARPGPTAWSPCACPSATATACSAGRWATASRSSRPPTCATRPAAASRPSRRWSVSPDP